MTLREAMAAAAQRDTIASEYVTDHAVTFELGLPALADALGDGLRARDAIVELALQRPRRRAGHADRPQARRRGRRPRFGGRCGRARRRRRAQLPAAGARWPGSTRSLRQDGNALNPGTTADLVTAVLFVAVLEGVL